jgi:para-aminobenzoate synthetase component I
MRMSLPREVLPAAVRTLPREMDPLELVGRFRSDPYPALLVSGRRDGEAGRFSVVASDPFQTLRFRQGKGILKSRRRERMLAGDPFQAVRESLEGWRVPKLSGIPFCGGAVGYLAYGLGAEAGARPRRAAPSPWPDLHLAFYGCALVVDHREECTHLIATGFPERSPERRREKQRLDLARLAEAVSSPPHRDPLGTNRTAGPPVFHTPRREYLRAIARIQEYLAAGDAYQVNLSHRIDVAGEWAPLPLFRRLMDRHPARFAAFLPMGDHAVLCASPERLARLEGRRAETRPIKGTRARPAIPGEEPGAAEALAGSEKERSENVMIVDLARNDLGKVCIPGSVVTEDLCRVETLPSVHHLVSTVSGRLREECDGIDLMRALFPGGSMTGAPKIRAMEIIDELEPEDRGIYSGSVGYFSFDGELDMNIVIRTLIVSGKIARLQVGGAILVESDPEAEYQETLDKARPLLELLQEGSRG